VCYILGKEILSFSPTPSAVTNDSAFPFKPGEEVKIIIKDKKFIVEK